MASIYNSHIETIYSHPIFKSLLKNEVTIYGSFVREVLYESTTIDDFICCEDNSFKIINCYARSAFKDIIERDLDEYIYDILTLTSSTSILESTRCDFVTYTLKYKGATFLIDLSYVKSSLSYYLNYYRTELDISIDIDCLYIDRTGTGSLSINSLYSTSPIPLYKIIQNINNKKFKILSKTNLLYNKHSYRYVKYLKDNQWSNIDYKLVNYTDIADEDKQNYDLICPICNEKHDNRTIQLLCGHLFHSKCLNGYIDNYINDKKYKQSELSCPYCTKNLNILELL